MKNSLLIFLFQIFLINGFAQSFFKKNYLDTITGISHHAFQIIETSDHNYLALGRARNNSVWLNFSLIKIGVTGNVIWAKDYVDSTLSHEPYSLLEMSNKNYFIY